MAATKKAASSSDDADSKPTSKKKGATYRVTAPLISAHVGQQVLQFSSGDILPDGLDQDSLDHLLDLGFIAEND